MADQSQGDGWWQASHQKWYPPESHPDYVPAPPPPTQAAPPPLQSRPPQGTPCQVCGHRALRPIEIPITTKRRVKFGIFWVLLSLISLGLGIILWLIMPRKTEVIGVDRYMHCQACGARQG